MQQMDVDLDPDEDPKPARRLNGQNKQTNTSTTQQQGTPASADIHENRDALCSAISHQCTLLSGCAGQIRAVD